MPHAYPDDDARFVDAVGKLERYRHRGIQPGTARMSWLCTRLGHPERSAPAIHITGTNGKGSTAKMAAALLGATGRRVGLYTSPHLVDITERISVAGEAISHTHFADLVDELLPLFDEAPRELGESITHFEALTAIGLVAFARAALDAVVVEVGLGGRSDDTNVVDGKVAVVTNIDIDHTSYLGATREEIATEKAGIIKSGAVAVIGEHRPELRAILERRCEEVGATPWRLADEFRVLNDGAGGCGRDIEVATPGGRYRTSLPLLGPYQAANAACALAAVEAFLGHPVEATAVADGIGALRIPAHFEVFGDHPAAVVDVAHNPHGIAALVAGLDEMFPGRERVVVFGAGPDKDARTMVGRLRSSARALVVTECRDAPHWPVSELARFGTEAGFPRVAAEAEPGEAVALAHRLAGPSDVVVLTGSHYWIGLVYPNLAGRFGLPPARGCPDGP